jgi:hypothetical protein
MDRRGFLKFVAGGATLLGSLSVINSCSDVRREDLSEYERKGQTVGQLGHEKNRILYLASLAPSSHNTQPWTVRVLEPRHWIIGSDKNRWLPAVDPGNREVMLSLGAFVENLVIAAEAHGYLPEITFRTQSPMDREVLDIRLKNGPVREFPLEKITKRRTVRRGFLDRVIAPDDLKYISKHDPHHCAISATAPHAFFFPNDSPQGKYLREETIEANRKQAFRDFAQEELSNWIRWSDKDARRRRDGLTPATMDIGGIAGFYVRNFYDRESVLSESFRKTTIDGVTKQVRVCGGWLVVTSADSSVPTLLDYGRVWESILLRARERMIAIHPMTQMLEETASRNAIAKELGLVGEVQWILRMGYVASYPLPVSLRRPLSAFISV